MTTDTPTWAADLADIISNRYELGLTDQEVRSLALLIQRHAEKHYSDLTTRDLLATTRHARIERGWAQAVALAAAKAERAS